jgi:hypothetical protein
VRKLCLTAITATTLALPLILITTQAQAAAPHPQRPHIGSPLTSVSYVHVCDAGSGALCLNDAGDNSTGGNPINLNSGAPNYSGERWLFHDAYVCPVNGGYTNLVTRTCPFANTTWDNSYVGDLIVVLQSTTANGCAAAKPSDPSVVALEDCSQFESDWVVAGSSHATISLINPYQTNNLGNGHVQALTGSNTAGDQATINNWLDGYLQGWNCVGDNGRCP